MYRLFASQMAIWYSFIHQQVVEKQILKIHNQKRKKNNLTNKKYTLGQKLSKAASTILISNNRLYYGLNGLKELIINVTYLLIVCLQYKLSIHINKRCHV